MIWKRVGFGPGYGKGDKGLAVEDKCCGFSDRCLLALTGFEKRFRDLLEDIFGQIGVNGFACVEVLEVDPLRACCRGR